MEVIIINGDCVNAEDMRDFTNDCVNKEVSKLLTRLIGFIKDEAKKGSYCGNFDVAGGREYTVYCKAQDILRKLGYFVSGSCVNGGIRSWHIRW